MNKEEAKTKAQYLIDKKYVENTDVETLADKILKSINNSNADHEAATSTRSEQP
jgi:DNA-binding protein YbaB